MAAPAASLSPLLQLDPHFPHFSGHTSFPFPQACSHHRQPSPSSFFSDQQPPRSHTSCTSSHSHQPQPTPTAPSVALVHDQPASCPLRFSPLGQQIGHHSRSTTTAPVPLRPSSPLKKNMPRTDLEIAEENKLIFPCVFVCVVVSVCRFIVYSLAGEKEKKRAEEERAEKKHISDLKEERKWFLCSLLCVFCLILQVSMSATTGETRKGRSRSAPPRRYCSPAVARGQTRH